MVTRSINCDAQLSIGVRPDVDRINDELFLNDRKATAVWKTSNGETIVIIIRLAISGQSGNVPQLVSRYNIETEFAGEMTKLTLEKYFFNHEEKCFWGIG